MTDSGGAAVVEAQGKGTNFLGVIAALEHLKGKPVVDATIAALPKEIGDAFRFGQIVSVGWYSVRWFRALLETMSEVNGDRGYGLVRTIAEETTTKDFKGLHRMVLKMLSIKTVTGHAHRLMQLYFRGGTAEASNLRPGVAVLRFKGWVGFHRIVWEDIAGSTQAVLTLAGGKDAQVRIVALSDNGADVEMDLRWHD